MGIKKVISAQEAIAIVHDDDVLATSGYGGNGTPDQLLVVLEKRYCDSGSPMDITLNTNSGFLRLKLGKELDKRKVSSRVFETGEEAKLHLTGP